MPHEEFGDVVIKLRSGMRGSRLFRKYFLAIMSSLMVGFAILAVTLLVFSVRFWTRVQLELLSANTGKTAQVVTELYGKRLDAGVRQLLILSLLQSHYETLGADFFLCDTQGRVVACREDMPDTLLPSPVRCQVHSPMRFPAKTVEAALRGDFRQTDNPGAVFPQQMLLAADPYSINGAPAGFMMAAQPLSPGLLSYMAGILRLLMLSALAVGVISFAAVYLITHRLVRPLQDMVQATKQYGKGDFGYRVKTWDSSELNQLGEAFNTMAISLATLESSRRSFVANVSHELKTPMTTIGGFIDGMLDGTIPAEERKKYLEVVSGEVRRLARLVTGMLNLSRVEAGELRMNLSVFEISELLFTTALSFEQIISRKGIELRGLEALAPISLEGDKDMLTQVFYNLIDNAVKFTPPGGRIEFQARREKDRAVFTLRNTGVGIASEEIGRVFERFYKTDQSRSYDTRGAGLGLYLSQTIVKMHGGSIYADSDGETYTCFTVELPC
jgi:signal transduction histidine kinase